jgi:hypothetical protein
MTSEECNGSQQSKINFIAAIHDQVSCQLHEMSDQFLAQHGENLYFKAFLEGLDDRKWDAVPQLVERTHQLECLDEE